MDIHSQTSRFASGIILVTQEPFQFRDWVVLSDQIEGEVVEIGLVTALTSVQLQHSHKSCDNMSDPHEIGKCQFAHLVDSKQ